MFQASFAFLGIMILKRRFFISTYNHIRKIHCVLTEKNIHKRIYKTNYLPYTGTYSNYRRN